MSNSTLVREHMIHVGFRFTQLCNNSYSAMNSDVLFESDDCGKSFEMNMTRVKFSMRLHSGDRHSVIVTVPNNLDSTDHIVDEQTVADDIFFGLLNCKTYFRVEGQSGKTVGYMEVSSFGRIARE